MADKRAIKVSTLDELAEGFQESRGITDKLTIKQMIAFAKEPVGGGENKLAQLVDGTLTDITAEDLGEITKLRSYAFYDSKSIRNITIPNSVITIGLSAFNSCSNLRNVIIGDNVTTIERDVFEFCYNLRNITIPSSVITIGIYALRMGYYDRKATITFLGTTPPTIDANAFNGPYLEKIIVPKGCGEAYKNATNWANYADYIEEAAE